VGWALGVERVLELLKEQGTMADEWTPDVYAIVPETAALPQVLPVLQSLRGMGVAVQMHAPADSSAGMGSMKSQFKKADASGAHYALVFGPDELAQGQVTVKSLRDGQGAQRTEALSQIIAWGHSLQSHA
jgi:histidyl-tRNA synthetase